RVLPLALRIRYEDHAVRAREDELARGVEIHLPWHREQLQAHVVPAHVGRANGQEIEVEGAIDRRREGDDLPAGLRRRRLMDARQGGGLPAEPWPVVHELDQELAREWVDLGQSSLLFGGFVRAVDGVVDGTRRGIAFAFGQGVEPLGRRADGVVAALGMTVFELHRAPGTAATKLVVEAPLAV